MKVYKEQFILLLPCKNLKKPPLTPILVIRIYSYFSLTNEHLYCITVFNIFRTSPKADPAPAHRMGTPCLKIFKGLFLKILTAEHA